MKKVFYQLHVRFIYACLMCMVFVGIGVTIIVVSILEKKYFAALIGIIPIVISTYVILSGIYNRVIFDNNKIKITGDLFKTADKTQFKDEILYKEILDVLVINSNINSKKQK